MVEALLASILVLLTLKLIFFTIDLSFHSLNYFTETFNDIRLTDIYYSSLSSERLEDQVVIVNVGEKGRDSISYAIQKLAQYNPKAIGVDIEFSDKFSVESHDSILVSTLERYKDILILGGFFDQKVDGIRKSKVVSNDMKVGHLNFSYDIKHEGDTSQNLTIRKFSPFLSDSIPSFSVQLLEKGDQEKYKTLISRENDVEYINYIGNQASFRTLEIDDVLSDSTLASVFSDAYIILGFSGSGTYTVLHDLKELFYTPKNQKFYGRSHPDMYGVYIHANILAMLLHSNYLDKIPSSLSYFLSFIIVFLHMYYFMYFYYLRKVWVHVVGKAMQIISPIVLIIIGLLILHQFNVLIDLKYLLFSIFLFVDVFYFYKWAVKVVSKYLNVQSLFMNLNV